MFSVWDVIIFEDIPETVFHADMVANNSTIWPNIFPVSILEGDFNNFPFDWLVVNNFNSVMNENCECECVSGDYFYYNYGSFGLSTMSGFEPMQFLYYDCGDDAGFNEQFNKKNLITTVDILGRETTNNKGFQLHIYDDGSIEKKYLIK